MADHKVRFEAPPMVLGRQDAVFIVDIDDEKLGELHISEGGVDWWPRNSKTCRRWSWSQFRDLMES